jgi:hypothetical protein
VNHFVHIWLALLVMWLLLMGSSRRNALAGHLPRTPKLVILARLVAIPFALLLCWGLMWCLADVGLGISFVLGGVIAVLTAIFFMQSVTNFGTFLYSPRNYRLWKAGGGDAFFDSLQSPLNNDPPCVRYQELFREQARLDCEEVDRLAGVQPQVPPDSTRGIDDPEAI